MTTNAASRRVLEKCGLTLVHTVPYRGPDADVIDGAGQGEVEYALTKSEWEPERAAELNSRGRTSRCRTRSLRGPP
jgi:RimJ/RimL family protein N-acetyltransferase